VALNIKDLTISSPDLSQGERLDSRFSQDGDNITPRLRIQGVPSGALELAIVCHDPDAPLPHGFTHWVLYGIPSSAIDLGAEPDATFRPGPNGAGSLGYIGPQPPAGHGIHHYYFWVYALNMHVKGTPSREEFLQTYADNILEQNRIVALYEN
jgi:Raf kinase inhibitor-like YbhB/YbcL family protein